MLNQKIVDCLFIYISITEKKLTVIRVELCSYKISVNSKLVVVLKIEKHEALCIRLVQKCGISSGLCGECKLYTQLSVAMVGLKC